MKIVQLLLFSALLIFKSTFAWECSRDCPRKDYETCKREQNRNRELGIFEDPDADYDEDMHTAAAHDIVVEPMTNLRGTSMYLNNTSRELGSSHFQVKMHWERLYCVSLFVSCLWFLCRSNESHRYASKSHKLTRICSISYTLTHVVASRDKRTKVLLGMPRFLQRKQHHRNRQVWLWREEPALGLQERRRRKRKNQS